MIIHEHHGKANVDIYTVGIKGINFANKFYIDFRKEILRFTKFEKSETRPKRCL